MADVIVVDFALTLRRNTGILLFSFLNTLMFSLENILNIMNDVRPYLYPVLSFCTNVGVVKCKHK